MDHGHPHAWRYPLGMLMDEETLVRQRQNQDAARRLLELNLAVAAVISQDAVRQLNQQVQRLTDVEA